MKKTATILLTAALSLMAAGLAIAQSSEKKTIVKTAEKKEEPRNAKSNALKGKAVFEEQCAICHFSASNEKKIGPGLKAIYRTGKFANGKKVDDASMRAWIENGGVDMPSFKDSLTAQQIADLLAYLRTL
ncbi:MAG TPA: cytochrome c [Candidatus Acidoferrales bacterium]|jgi:mono/diheme cytochrome c family protein|nr:cytochrome c [Candidatus Acidoferrales bacterium]